MKNIFYLYVTRLNACPGNQPQCYCPIQCLVRKKKKKKKLWHKCKKMATLQVRCWYRRHVELLRRRWRDVWREDRSVNETDETRQREKRRVNRLILAAWSPGLGSALAGRESLRLALQSTRGRIERSPTFDPIRTQAWTLPPPYNTSDRRRSDTKNMKGLKVRSSVISVSVVHILTVLS